MFLGLPRKVSSYFPSVRAFLTVFAGLHAGTSEAGRERENLKNIAKDTICPFKESIPTELSSLRAI